MLKPALTKTAFAALLIGAALPTAVWSQPADAAAAARVADDLTTIIVTARRRAETLIEVPISVSALTAADIDRANIRDTSEIALRVPGFSMQNISGGTEQPFIRGMSANSFSRTEQTASTLQDGIYASTLGRTVFPGDIERVEVIRGPQAALFGRATFAGAINYITKKPTEASHSDFRLGAGQHGRLDGHASQSGAIVPGKLLFRVSGNGQKYDGQYVNTLDGGTLGVLNRANGNVWLTYMPTETFTANLRVSRYWRRDDRQLAGYIQPATLNNCYPDAQGRNQYYCGIIKADPKYLAMNLDKVDDGFSKTNQTRVAFDLNADLGPFEFVSTTGYIDENGSTFFDGDYTKVNAFATKTTDVNRNVSQEFRLASPTADRFNYMVGAYFFRETSNSRLAAAAPTLSRVETSAGFGSLTFKFTDKFNVSLDGRYQEEVQNFTASSGAPFRVSTKALLPRAIVQLQPDAETNFYASVSKGSNPARFNASTNVPLDRIKVDEEQIISYEIGAKARRGPVELNLAGYYIDWSNQAYRIEVTGNNGLLTNILGNLGGSRIRGFEADGRFAVSKQLKLSSTFSYIDARYTDFLSPNALRVLGNAQVAGNRLLNTPKYTASVQASFQQPSGIDDYDFFVNADYSRRSQQFTSEINKTISPAMNLANLRAGLTNKNLRFEVAVLNLLNDDSPEFATRFTDFGSGSPTRFAPLIRLRDGRAFETRVRYSF